MDTPEVLFTKQHGETRNVFLYLANFIGIYVISIAAIVVTLAIIDFVFPSSIGTPTYDGYANLSLYFPYEALATLIITFPIYMVVTVFLERLRDQNPTQEFKARIPLTYITLFVTGIAIIVSLITLLYNFLTGDYVSKYFVATGVVLFIAAIVFTYYITSLMRKPGEKRAQLKIFAYGSSALVIIITIASLVVTGGPATNRLRNLDNNFAGDLENLANNIDNTIYSQYQLPDTLQSLKQANRYGAYSQPDRIATIEYLKISTNEYQLCAAFLVDNPPKNKQLPAQLNDPKRPFAYHSTGRNCFTRIVTIPQKPPRIA